MADYHRYYNKNNSYKVSRSDYAEVVSEMNKYVTELMLDMEGDFRMPYRCGAVAIRKKKRKITFDSNGNIINTNPPDWQKTRKLWEKDEEAKEKKILIRHTNMKTSGYVFKVTFLRSLADFKNKKLYGFRACRNFARGLNKRINDYTKIKFDSPKSK